MNQNQLRINGARLWSRMMELAQIGETEKGGVCRVALTDEDRIGRDWFIEKCKMAGCTILIDEMGNIFARRAGLDNDAPPILFGSHLDSQPTGGKFDGAYGVLAALEIIETLNDHNVETDIPLEIVSWTNEEGARFAPAMVSSGVFGGAFTLEYGLSREDKEGRTIGEELNRIGYAGDAPIHGRKYAAFFEIHIEQGPILEANGLSVGVVTGVQGMRWYHLHLLGKETHAGSTPMERRQDPVQAMLPIMQQMYRAADTQMPDIRLTFGDFQPSPGVINTVPGRLTVTVDMRHPDDQVLEELEKQFHEIVAKESEAKAIPASLERIWNSPAVHFDEKCIDAVRRAVEITGERSMEMVSGAGHDAVYVSRIVPTTMIFVPCEDGLSHNELENAEQEDLIAGNNVLLHAVLGEARRADHTNVENESTTH